MYNSVNSSNIIDVFVCHIFACSQELEYAKKRSVRVSALQNDDGTPMVSIFCWLEGVQSYQRMGNYQVGRNGQRYYVLVLCDYFWLYCD